MMQPSSPVLAAIENDTAPWTVLSGRSWRWPVLVLTGAGADRCWC
jgi:hypothetical protein